MIINLNENIKKCIQENYLPTHIMVSYLIENGFETEKEIYKTSLSDLKINDKNIIDAYIDIDENKICITLNE